MMKDKDITKDMERWEFNDDVTGVFNEMLERSIPSYHRMRCLVTGLCSDYIKQKGLYDYPILDLGCSTGEQIQLFRECLPNPIIGCEISEPMLEHSREKFKEDNTIRILDTDIAKQPLPNENYCLITSILTIQFTPIEYRQKILCNIHESLIKEGVFIFVEKIIGDNSTYTEMYEKEYHKHKKIQGYTEQEIRDKKLKLEGVLMPVSDTFNRELLKQAGFHHFDVFWKDLQFVGYVAIKD